MISAKSMSDIGKNAKPASSPMAKPLLPYQFNTADGSEFRALPVDASDHLPDSIDPSRLEEQSAAAKSWSGMDSRISRTAGCPTRDRDLCIGKQFQPHGTAKM